MPKARSLRVKFIGEGIAFGGAIERARARGHTISGVFANSAAEGAVFSRAGLSTADEKGEPSAFLAQSQFDLLLSVNNRHILRVDALTQACVASVNYHNAPLPAYAGLRATAWAVLHGAPEHGVTWHLIEPGIDTGAILAQRHFPLGAEETTASLNARCTAAALESLEEVFDAVERGKLEGVNQDFKTRSYFGRKDVVPDAGYIDWRWSSDRICRLVRACFWGIRPNDFGSATIAVATGPSLFVRSAEPAQGEGPPGTVLAAQGNTLTVACKDGAVSFTLEKPTILYQGETLPLLERDSLEWESVLHRGSLLTESRWLKAFRRVVELPPGSSEARAEGALQTGGGEEAFLAAVSRVLGRDAIVALEANDVRSGVLDRWIPIFAGEGLPADSISPLLDVGRRHPEFATLSEWSCRAVGRVLRSSALCDLSPGSIAFAPDGRILYRGAPTTAQAVADAMGRATGTLLTPSAVSSDDAKGTVIERLAERALEDAHASAIEEDRRITTRGELAARAGDIAVSLALAGMRKDDGVGLLLPPGADYVAAALGAMQARGAYVPLDLSSPYKRWEAEIQEAGITHILTTTELAGELHFPGVRVLTLDVAGSVSAMPPLAKVVEDDCAYRIFTSGSTGTPKAVEITHGALANLIAHYLQAIPMKRQDRMTMLAHSTFDASVGDLWPILAAGGTLLVPPACILRDPPRLIEWLTSSKSTCTFVPTVIAERLFTLPWPEKIALHTLLTGGDTLHRCPPIGFPSRVINTYGPTENTVDSLWSHIDPGSGRPPIGRPIGGVMAAIVDETGSPVRRGEIGELVLSGSQLARGYRGQPELTSKKFEVQLSPAEHRRYRTGDRARVNEAGEFEFHGRIDDQVQVLGVRIEPGEIEAFLRSDHRVEEAVCLPQRAGEEVTGLIAYVVPTKDTPTYELAASLRRGLAEHLPRAVVPKMVHLCGTLPRTAAGKVDRHALGEQHPVEPAESGPVDMDRVLAIWRRLLPGTEFATDEESFWELGGDSLAAMSLLLDVEAETGVRVPIGHFLAQPTLAGLRWNIRKGMTTTVVQLRKGSGAPLVCWYTLSGDLEAYQYLVEQLGDDDHPILGIVSPAITDGAALAESIEGAVAEGLSALRDFGVAEAPALLGYSWGGLLAFEAARQLSSAGTPPPFVGLIGTVPPITHRSRRARVMHLLRYLPIAAWGRFRSGRPAPEETLAASVRRISRLLRAGGVTPETNAWPVPIQKAHVALGFRYRPASTTDAIKLHLFRDLALRRRVDHLGYIRYDKTDLGWGAWAGREPVIHWIDGHHNSLMKGASVAELARVLGQVLQS